MSTYLVGQPAVLHPPIIENAAGVATNPAVIRLLLRSPRGAITTKLVGDLTHNGAGDYEYVFVPTFGDGGEWAWRWEYENPTGAVEGTFQVRESALHGGDANQPTTGPCGWWTDYDTVVARPSFPAGTSTEQVYQAIAAASDVCFQLGGRRWPGVCDATVQIAGTRGSFIPLPAGGVVSMRAGMAWGWWAPAGTVGSFFCLSGREIQLPGPILSVAEVRVDGVALDADAYVIVDWTSLVRIDDGVWPAWGLTSDAIPRLEIDYSYGQSPPEIGRLAAAAVAHELVLAMGGSDDCRLDRRVTSLSREGITEQLALGLPGLAESLRDGQTGIPEVDLFVHAHNPKGLRRPARFLGLDRGSEVSRRS